KFLGYQIHSVVQRSHQTNGGSPVKSRNFPMRVVFSQQQNRLPLSILESRIDSFCLGSHLVQELLITRNVRPAWRSDLHKRNPVLIFRINFQKSFNSAEPFQDSFCVVHAIYANSKQRCLRTKLLKKRGALFSRALPSPLFSSAIGKRNADRIRPD